MECLFLLNLICQGQIGRKNNLFAVAKECFVNFSCCILTIQGKGNAASFLLASYIVR